MFLYRRREMRNDKHVNREMRNDKHGSRKMRNDKHGSRGSNRNEPRQKEKETQEDQGMRRNAGGLRREKKGSKRKGTMKKTTTKMLHIDTTA